MKEKVLSFFKPRLWTVFFALFLVAWEYLYAFRGIDLGVLSQVRTYFGFGLTAISWNNFLIRTFSLGLIWLFVALFIFFLLWMFEAYQVSAHNRRVAKNYLNQPQENYVHLLKTRDISFKKHFGSQLWLSAFFIFIPVGVFLLAGLIESVRSAAVISYLTAAQDAGTDVNYNDNTLLIVTFLLTLPFWYLFACFDTWCFGMSRKESQEAKIEDDHYAVPVEAPGPEDADEDDEEESGPENDSNLPASPVI